MSDDEIRTEVKETLKVAFAKLNVHTHGEGQHASLLASAQSHIARAVEDLCEIDARPTTSSEPFRQPLA